MLVSNLFENNPQENGMAVLKQLATAVRDHTDIDLKVGNELLPIKYYQANHLISRWKALASSRQQNQALASFGDINWINDVLDAVDAKMAAGAKVGSVEGGRDVDEGRTQMYSDGDRVKLNSTYANSDNPNEIYTVAQCDQDRKRCWIGDKSGSGWYVTFDQIIPAISSDTEGQGRPYWSRIHDSSLKETSTIDGKTEDPGTLRWKQTSDSYEVAVEKYGQANVRKEGMNRAGQEVIAVHVPLGEQAVSLGNNDEYNDESGMSYNSLRTIHRATKGLANTIKDGDNLPEWCQKKISLAEDYLVTVWDYLQSEKGVAEGEIWNAVKKSFTPDPSRQSNADIAHMAMGAMAGATHGHTVGHAMADVGVAEGLTQTLRKFDPTIKARIRSKSQDQTNQGIDTIQHLADLDLTSDDMVSRAMKPNTYFKNAERYAKLAKEGMAEGLGYSQDPAQAKWYHEGRMAFKGGTTGNLIQDIAKKHGCPPEWLKAFHAGYQDQEGFSKDGVAEGETTLTKTGRIHRSTDAYGGSPPEPDPVGDELDKSGTSRIDRALGVRFKTKGYQKDTNTVSEAPGDKGSSQEHLAMLQAEKKEHEQAQRAKQEKMDQDLENYQAGRVRASDIKVAEGKDPTTDAAQEAYGFQRGEVKKNKDGSYVATNHAGSRKIFKSQKAAKAHADSGSQDMSEGWKDNLGNAAKVAAIAGGAIGLGVGADYLDKKTPHVNINGEEIRIAPNNGVGSIPPSAEIVTGKDGKKYYVYQYRGSMKQPGHTFATPVNDDVKEGSVNEVSVDALSRWGKALEKSAAKNADLSGQYQEKAFNNYNKGGAAADRSWDDLDKAKEYAAIAARRNAGADLAAVKLGRKFSKGMVEARSVDDLQNELTSWKKEGPWKKTTTKDPRGKAPNLSDRARRETEKMSKELNPTTKKV